MRVLVSVDMEGSPGWSNGDDVIPGRSEYERNRKLLTAEANAAARGVHAFAAGAQVLVTDAHGASGTCCPNCWTGVPSCCAAVPSPAG